MFKRRIGPDPHHGGEVNTAGAKGCPDVWELDNGDFAVIGFPKPDLAPMLPPSASCGPDETIVVVPRSLLLQVKNYIPDA